MPDTQASAADHPHDHTPHPQLARHKKHGVHTTMAELDGFNGKLALR